MSPSVTKDPDTCNRGGNALAGRRLDKAAHLFPGERLRIGHGCPQLAYFRQSSCNRPLAVFLPGAGHLARVAYGHPGARPSDFLDFWLRERGYGLLALSYPSDHLVFDGIHPFMTIADWAQSSATITRDVIDENGLGRSILLVGWSMAGRIAPSFNRAAAERNLDVVAFVSLAATPPIPGLGPFNPAGETLTEDLLWDAFGPTIWGWSRQDRFWAGIGHQNDLNGRVVMSRADCQQYYWANSPLHLHGLPHRLRGARLVEDVEEALADLRTFAFSDYPLTGMVIPGSPADARHGLTDQASWSFFNAQVIHQRHFAHEQRSASPLPEASWHALKAITADLPTRLTRHVDGGHFMFLGEDGARQTARWIAELHGEIEEVHKELEVLLPLSR
jgi:hypothetical protein